MFTSTCTCHVDMEDLFCHIKPLIIALSERCGKFALPQIFKSQKQALSWQVCVQQSAIYVQSVSVLVASGGFCVCRGVKCIRLLSEGLMSIEAEALMIDQMDHLCKF